MTIFEISVIIGILILLIITISIKLKTKKNSKEKENDGEKINFRDRAIVFLKSKEYKYLTNFAKLHKSNYKYFSEEEELNNNEHIDKEISKLKRLLEKKGIAFNIKQLKLLIYDEIVIQTYEDFKIKILSHKPNNLKEYIKVFLEFYSDDYDEFLNYYHFKILLSENGIEYNEYNLKDEINFLKRDLEL